MEGKRRKASLLVPRSGSLRSARLPETLQHRPYHIVRQLLGQPCSHPADPEKAAAHQYRPHGAGDAPRGQKSAERLSFPPGNRKEAGLSKPCSRSAPQKVTCLSGCPILETQTDRHLQASACICGWRHQSGGPQGSMSLPVSSTTSPSTGGTLQSLPPAGCSPSTPDTT